MQPHADFAQDYLDETRAIALDLIASLSRSNADPHIRQSVIGLIGALPEMAAGLASSTLEPHCLTIESLARKHGVAGADRELSAATLAELETLSLVARRLCACLAPRV